MENEALKNFLDEAQEVRRLMTLVTDRHPWPDQVELLDLASIMFSVGCLSTRPETGARRWIDHANGGRAPETASMLAETGFWLAIMLTPADVDAIKAGDFDPLEEDISEYTPSMYPAQTEDVNETINLVAWYLSAIRFALEDAPTLVPHMAADAIAVIMAELGNELFAERAARSADHNFYVMTSLEYGFGVPLAIARMVKGVPDGAYRAELHDRAGARFFPEGKIGIDLAQTGGDQTFIMLSDFDKNQIRALSKGRKE